MDVQRRNLKNLSKLSMKIPSIIFLSIICISVLLISIPLKSQGN